MILTKVEKFMVATTIGLQWQQSVLVVMKTSCTSSCVSVFRELLQRHWQEGVAAHVYRISGGALRVPSYNFSG
jgi:hypothetical protein